MLRKSIQGGLLALVSGVLWADDALPVGPNPMANWIMLLAFGAVMYLMWRPQMKRAKAHQALLGGLRQGDEVVTAGGLMGTVTQVNEQFVRLRVADGVELRMQKHAVSGLLPQGTCVSIQKSK